jgi:ATP-dependent exoDNAse (exonuclease V) alpha subunit
VFRPAYSTLFTSTALLDAEARLRQRADDATGPRTAPIVVRAIAQKRLPGGMTLSDSQLDALTSIADSGRVIDVLVGPAGAGKTTAMAVLRRAWERSHGSNSVVGLAPSAASAQVLAEDLGIGTENLAKWWNHHLRSGSTFRDGQLVIIDEASLAGTVALDQITSLAAQAGAKVLLVGDLAQLQSVTAGGAFSLLVHDHDDAPELLDVHRFTHEWAKSASLSLRQGAPQSIDLHNAHGRVQIGSTESIVDAAYEAWRKDCESGRASVLSSDYNEAVAAMNIRARSERILDGSVDALQEVALHDGTRAAVGDIVITRRNDCRLRTARSWVRNGDGWTVVRTGRDSSVEVRRAGRRWGSTALLPAEYVKHHIELGYAVTAHRAQGMTTESAHAVVASGMTRENLYVAMTRGRESNIAYVALDQPDVAHSVPRPGDNPDKTARSILDMSARSRPLKRRSEPNRRFGGRSPRSRPSTRPLRRLLSMNDGCPRFATADFQMTKPTASLIRMPSVR